MAYKDMTGEKCGMLSVLSPQGKDNRGEMKWLCKCDCGNETVVLGSHLRKGHQISCGCYRKEMIKTHNMSKTRIYRIWQKMKSRCYNKSNENFEYYGGRGITVCNEWNEFENFYDWSMENGYLENLSIDRIDVNGNYEPSNCRWITSGEQHRNTRRNVFLTDGTEVHCMSEWAKMLGVPKETFRNKAYKGEEVSGRRFCIVCG